MSNSSPISPSLIRADNSKWFAICIGIAILGYLLPWHSPLGRDFLVNAFSFIFVCLGIAGFFWQNSVFKTSLSAMTWLLLAGLLTLQPWLLTIAYPDALIFPITCLLIVTLATVSASNLNNKSAFLNHVFLMAYVMAILTFAGQIMQIFHYQISWQGWIIARGNANNMRFDGNFGQPNHTAYGFVLALCGVIYQIHQSFLPTQKTTIAKDLGLPQFVLTRSQYYRFGLMVLFVLFTIGLALTQSRAGLIMMLAVMGVYFVAQPLGWGKKFTLASIGAGFFLLYYVGTSWLAGLIAGAGNLGAVSRLSGGQGNRSALSERAMMMFHDHPIWGVGWNNYMSASVDYAQQFKWPEIADHSHNFVTMILAEMGVVGALCFLPIVWLLLKAIHFRHSSESAIALAFVVASLLYASVEYPLWYFRYLAVFAVFLALVEQRYMALHLPEFLSKLLSKTVAVMMAWLIGAAGFYSQTYLQKNYLDYNAFVTHKNHLFSDSQIDFRSPVYGFGAYEGRLLAMQVPVNNHEVDKKLEIFDDVITSDSSQFNLLAKAQLLTYKGDKKAALEQVQAACVMVRDVTDCDNVDIDLEKLADNNPAVFGDLYTEFVQWRHDNPVKTGLISANNK